jgi:hypothetical protein
MPLPAKKITIITSFVALPLLFIVIKNFFYYRKGWQAAEIQLNAIFWLVRFLLCPFVIYFTVSSWKELSRLQALLLIHITGFTIYTLLFWGIGFPAAMFTSGFDGRKLNLFNIVKGASFQLNLLVYIVTAFTAYLWTYFEANLETGRKLSTLEQSLNELKAAVSKKDTKQTGKQPLTKLTIRNGYKTTILSIQDILYFLSDGAYVKAVTGNGMHLISTPLYKLQARLPGMFLRIHRSHIVNSNHIRETRSLLNGDYTVVLQNGTELRASRTYRENLKTILSP